MRIHTDNLTKKYQIGPSEISAVNRITLDIKEGEFLAIIGPSGSGKSTLLNLIGLNDRPSSGQMYIDDSSTSLLSTRERRKIRLYRMGFIFQTFNLLPTLNALENIEVPMAFAKVSQRQQKEKALKLLTSVGLENRAEHTPKELSMGEMQRVAIARALANDPEMLIADEPTGELDSKTAQEIISLLLELNANKKTAVVVATHDEKLVEAAESIYGIRDGAITPME